MLPNPKIRREIAPATARLMSTLPEEMQAEILLRLPVKSILICKCVCKLWFNLISRPNFIDNHLHLSIQNKNNHKFMFTDRESDTGNPLIYSVDFASLSSPPPDLSCDYIGDEAVLMDAPFEYKKGMEILILGACHGLICFAILYDKETSIWIWNPATREYKEFQNCDFNSHSFGAGFGYDTKTGDYKIVIFTDSKKSDYCEVEVYTFGFHLSKTVHTFHYKFPTFLIMGGVFHNGAIHWINNLWMQHNNSIICFDISNEKLSDVPLPEISIIHPEDSDMRLCQKLGVLGGCLSLVLIEKTLVRAEVWVMLDYGVRESWTKLFATTQQSIINYPCSCLPVLSLKNGEILMYTYDGFVLCNPKNGKVGKMSSFFQENSCVVRGITMMSTPPESYIESLVSLKSGNNVQKAIGQKSRDVE